MSRAVILALLMAACASSEPAPISYGSGALSPPRQPAYQPAPVEMREPARPQPAAQQQQPAPDWADGEGTPLSAYALQPGDVQPYDPANLPRTHRVQRDESLYDIAATYQIPLRALIDQNGLEPPYALAPGRELQLPPPRFHEVRRGESFEDVARAYNVDLRSLALLNRMQPPYRVSAGDRIVLPAMARAIVQPPAPTPTPQPVTPPQLTGARFSMPVDGEIVAPFGAQASGGRLDGIEIAAREGAQVLAAAEGEVVYAGDDLEAYGWLVLVRHAENYVTAYAYNRRALVREGDRVRAGQAIAELGARADGRPRLMFQVRLGSQPVDPVPLLGRRRG